MAIGFGGPAYFTLTADDGYTTSQPVNITVTVSEAPLEELEFVTRKLHLSAVSSILH